MSSLIWPFCFSILSLAIAQAPCPKNQSTPLLQFKQGLIISPPRLQSWIPNSDCCKWEGIACNNLTGFVQRLNLCSLGQLPISGNISFSLFNLTHLEYLDLSFNNLSSSSIPPSIGQLKGLVYLNLSNSGFSGQIPKEISELISLVHLDLSTSPLFSSLSSTPLKLEDPDFKTLVQSLKSLKELRLDRLNLSSSSSQWCQALASLPRLTIVSLQRCSLSGPFDESLQKLVSLSEIHLDGNSLASTIPDWFASFSNLKELHLSLCDLKGEFPAQIFQLQRLQMLDVSYNIRLSGYFPYFPPNSPIKNLLVSNTNFSGPLPDSIGNLGSLIQLELNNCSFNGSIPVTLSNIADLLSLDLSFNQLSGGIPSLGSQRIQEIDLSHNLLTGSIPTSLGKLRNLTRLNLKNNQLIGSIPSSLFTLPSLKVLDLSENGLDTSVPDFQAPQSKLETLDLSENGLNGEIPGSIFSLSNLKVLILSSNKFNGTLHLESFLPKSVNLSNLDLSRNNLVIEFSSLNSSNGNESFPHLSTLKLRSCNITKFPDFIKTQERLKYLDLSDNLLEGAIPNWLWKLSLNQLNLSKNQLQELGQLANPSSSSFTLDLHSNHFSGPPSLPSAAIFLDYSNNLFSSSIPESIGIYLNFSIFLSLSHNNLSGKIPSSLCNSKNLQVLDLSHNNLIGSIPECLFAIDSLIVLNLRENMLQGSIPDRFRSSSDLRTLNFNGNQLQGEVPLSLSKCSNLEILDLGNNNFSGTFPSSLGSLTHLRVLVLRSNQLHGPISDTGSPGFYALQILDLSGNNFSGPMPKECFQNWKAMQEESQTNSTQILQYGFLYLSSLYYFDMVTVTMKGQDLEFQKILTILTAIDISNNAFEGVIPSQIGGLKGLRVLNMSRNTLTGPIPDSIGDLRQLESLDLSKNHLSGSIPLGLSKLSFLSVLNLSWNNLSGTIPKGYQFQTFNAASFAHNPGLCGYPLDVACGQQQKNSTTNEEAKATSWEFVLGGLGFGIGGGVVGRLLMAWKDERLWYFECVDRVLGRLISEIGLNRIEAEEEGEDGEEKEGVEEDSLDQRFCVFCTGLDTRKWKAVHTECSCRDKMNPIDPI
ncbi:hypothetical protein AMTRI_Chr08g159730 [Amborella trichopoda]